MHSASTKTPTPRNGRRTSWNGQVHTIFTLSDSLEETHNFQSVLVSQRMMLIHPRDRRRSQSWKMRMDQKKKLKTQIASLRKNAKAEDRSVLQNGKLLWNESCIRTIRTKNNEVNNSCSIIRLFQEERGRTARTGPRSEHPKRKAVILFGYLGANYHGLQRSKKSSTYVSNFTEIAKLRRLKEFWKRRFARLEAFRKRMLEITTKLAGNVAHELTKESLRSRTWWAWSWSWFQTW